MLIGTLMPFMMTLVACHLPCSSSSVVSVLMVSSSSSAGASRVKSIFMPSCSVLRPVSVTVTRPSPSVPLSITRLPSSFFSQTPSSESMPATSIL